MARIKKAVEAGVATSLIGDDISKMDTTGNVPDVVEKKPEPIEVDVIDKKRIAFITPISFTKDGYEFSTLDSTRGVIQKFVYSDLKTAESAFSSVLK